MESQIKHKISLDALNDCGRDIFIKDLSAKFEKSFGDAPNTYFFTFEFADGDKNLITLFMGNKDDGRFLCRLPKDRPRELLPILGNVNSHLTLRIEHFGYNGDDFVNNYESYIIKYQKKALSQTGVNS